jgi:hypothetical protein
MSRGSDNVTTCESRRWYQQWWCHHLWYMEMLHQTSEILTNCGRLIVMSQEMRLSCEGGTSGFGNIEILSLHCMEVISSLLLHGIYH